MKDFLARADEKHFPEQVEGKNIKEIYPASKLVDFLKSDNKEGLAVYLG